MNQQELKAELEYSPITGLFTRKICPQCPNQIGKIAGHLRSDNYIAIKLKGKRYLAHCLAALYMTGTLPKKEIDHINGDRSDNRWGNLREVDKRTNLKNRVIPKTNKSGTIGVCWDRRNQAWLAQIATGTQRKHLGYFTNLSEAVLARKSAEKLYGFHQNHGRAAA